MFLFLKDRAKRFLEVAKGDLDKKYYDFCLFHVEQMLQLILKYLIALKTDDFPRTHYLSVLFKDVDKLYKGKRMMKVYKDNISIITALEQAYIGSRYLDVKFDRQVALEAIKFAKSFMKLAKELEKNES